MRLPASSVKLGEKLERYHTAIQVWRGSSPGSGPLPRCSCSAQAQLSGLCLCFQRSESVRSQGSSRTEFFVAPVGVASKRHLFEKELAGQSRAEPASSRKVRDEALLGSLQA